MNGLPLYYHDRKRFAESMASSRARYPELHALPTQEILDSMSAQSNSASSNVCTLDSVSPSSHFDYDAYTAGYGGRSSTESSLNDEASINQDDRSSAELHFQASVADLQYLSLHSSTSDLVSQSADSGSGTLLSTKTYIEASISQETLAFEISTPSTPSQDSRPEVRVCNTENNEIAPTNTLRCDLQHCESCASEGKCDDPHWCKRLDILNARVVAMIEDGRAALGRVVDEEDER